MSNDQNIYKITRRPGNPRDLPDRLLLRLPAGTLARIDALSGTGRRSEFVREAIRKPFVVYNVVMGNQVLPEEVAQMRQRGYLESGVWTKAFVAENYPQAVAGDPKHIDYAKLLELPPSDRVALGHVLFMHHCNDCHAADVGYSAAGPLLRGFPREKILSTVRHLETKFFMPPWCGTAEEAELITDYLVNISEPRPEGMRLGLQAEEVK